MALTDYTRRKAVLSVVKSMSPWPNPHRLPVEARMEAHARLKYLLALAG